MFSFNLALPNENSFIFNTPGITPFVKPYGIKFVHIICIGGGGAGGAGATVINSAGGGGGGGAAGITTGLFPADFLPDILYIDVGAGGEGGTGTGGTGESSIVFLLNQVSTTTKGILLSAPGGTGGGTTSTSTRGAAGALVSAATITAMPAASIGVFTSMDGPAGALGGDEISGAGIGLSIIALASSIVCGGAGGGGLGFSGFRFSGGSVAATTNATGNINLPTISGGTSSTPAQAQNGTFIFAPHFVSLGGAGGAGDTTISKPGGIGGMGSGGGGGGAGRPGFGAGNGGNGGNGIVIISCW